jgi:hypothetical protein
VKNLLFLAFALFLSSCYKNHLYIQQESIDEKELASYYAGTPDPRMKNPPIGQKIIVSWDFSKKLFLNQIDHLLLTVHFWNLEEQKEEAVIDRRRGYASFFFPNPTKDPTKKILTYRVEVFKKDGSLFETWKHQFWTDLIKVGPPDEQGERQEEDVEASISQESCPQNE